jgi:hypothetical protein
MGLILPAAVAALVFVAVSTALATLAALVQGSVTSAGAAASLAVGLVAGMGAARGVRPGPLDPPSRWDWGALAVFAAAAVRHAAWILFERNGQIVTLDAFNYGDLPLHWTYIQFFARGASFWPENPIFTGARLQYPFGIDLFTALLVKLGLPMAGALRGVGLLGAALLIVGLFRWGRGFAVAAFLLSGGLGHDPAWKNLFLALFIPQRGFLFALPAGLLLLWSWRQGFFRRQGRLPAWVEGLLWGMMPLFHLHTFLFLSLIYAVWTLWLGRLREAWPTLAWAAIPALWATWEVTNAFRAASLVWWKPGGMIGGANVGAFLALNFTLFLPLFIVALGAAVRRSDREGLATLLPGLGLFVALFFVMLAPWEWDNTKVMIWCYLLMLPAAERLVIERLPSWGRVGLVALLLAPGAFTLGASLSPQAYGVAEADELSDVCQGVRALLPSGRVATVQTFNHPVALCGQPLVAGYAGHLWSHGIQAKPVEQALASLLAGEPGWEGRARLLHARYLFWGPRESAAYADSSRPWETSRPLVWEGAFGRLYDLGE